MTQRELTPEGVSLNNDGRLGIYFVGCGSAFAATLGQNNILIIKGDEHVLVDCGTKTPAKLRSVGVSITDIRTYLITHSHADHIGGLEEAILMGRYVAKRKPRCIINPSYQATLWGQSLRGGAAHNERHDGKELDFEDFFEVIRPEPLNNGFRNMEETRIGTLNIKTFRTAHFPQQSHGWQDSFYSVGLLIDDTILFTGDTKYDPELVLELYKRFDIDTIFHDCQFFTGGIHASLDQIAEFPEEIRRKTYLMHYADSYPSQQERVAELGFAGFARDDVIYEHEA